MLSKKVAKPSTQPWLIPPDLEINTPFERLCQAIGVAERPGWPDEFGRAIHAWSRSGVSRPIKTVSLFSGAGGLDIGFHDAGFLIDEMVEINRRYAATLQHNSAPGGYFGHGTTLPIDIRDYQPLKANEQRPKIDLIIGGPPCQTFSAGGRRAGGVQGTQDEDRGILFKQYVRLLQELEPSAFVFENVYGITGANEGKAWDQIRKAFASVGYTLAHRILDAADYGVPQHRERMIIVGMRTGIFLFPRPTHGPDSPGQRPYLTAARAIEGGLNDENGTPLFVNGKYGTLLHEIPPGLNYSFFTEKMGHPRPLFAWRSKFSDFLYKADPDSPVRTVKAFCGQYTGPFHWDNRRFSIAEFKRLQTFPDAYHIEGNRQLVLQQIGNSVPPQMARILALAVLEQAFGVKPPEHLPTLDPTERLTFRARKSALTREYQRRALLALNSFKPTPRRKDRNKCIYSCTVTDKFRFVSAPSGLACRAVVEQTKSSLLVSISKTRERDVAFVVTVEPAQGRQWVLPVERIEIRGSLLDRDVFLSGWRAAEAWMCTNRYKDDWVQLCGYFAYEPAVKAKMDIASPSLRQFPEWKVVSRVVNGVAVRETLSGEEMAGLLGVLPKKVLETLHYLRHIGYEVRSHKTNPQLAKGSFLIPYFFPTYTYRSVQLHKNLS
jgi:DNA (cytosine-5)-methyltransferase 1